MSDKNRNLDRITSTSEISAGRSEDQADVFFSGHMPVVATVAAQRLRIEREGDDPEEKAPDGTPLHQGTQVTIPVEGGATPEALHKAELKDAKAQAAARTLTRWAMLRDQRESGGRVQRFLAGAELRVAGRMDRANVGTASDGVRKSGGVIDKIRGKKVA